MGKQTNTAMRLKQITLGKVEAAQKPALMIKFFLSLLFLFYINTLMAQDTTIVLTAEEKAMLDSMFKNDAFLSMLEEKRDTSYVMISAGISNGVFSVKNNSLNAEQAITKKIFYTPALSYFHKSGFGISATGYLATDNGQLKFFQYALSPSYSYYSKKIDWGISYTRYIRGASTSFDINPYKNDFYGNFVLKKLWLRPAIGTGFSIGREKEYFDSVISFAQPPRTLTIRDTITTTLSSFSINFSISHIWTFEKVLFKNDELNLQPSVLVNGSNLRLDIKHSRNLGNRRPIVQKLLKIAYGDGTTKQKFSLQSLACSLDLSYGKGRFIIDPQIYLDYYLHETDSNRFSAIYSFMISYAF